MSVKGKSIASDLQRLKKMKDEEIDYSDIPPLDESFLILQIPQITCCKTKPAEKSN